MAVEHGSAPEHLVLAVADFSVIVLIGLNGKTEIHGMGPAQLTPLALRTVAHQVERDLIMGNGVLPEVEDPG